MLKNGIQRILTKQGKSQLWLSDMTGISKGMISQITSGRSIPTSEELSMICGVLRCRREELYNAQSLAIITGKEEPEAEKKDTTKKVRMTEPVTELIDEFAKRYQFSRDEAARMLVMAGLMASKVPGFFYYEDPRGGGGGGGGYSLCETR